MKNYIFDEASFANSGYAIHPQLIKGLIRRSDLCDEYLNRIEKRTAFGPLLGANLLNKFQGLGRELKKVSEQLVATVYRYSIEILDLAASVRIQSGLEEKRFEDLLTSIKELSLVTSFPHIEEPSFGREMVQVVLDRSKRLEKISALITRYNDLIHTLRTLYYKYPIRRTVMWFIRFPGPTALPLEFSGIHLTEL